jgi:SAM-dependent methyltransferase
VLSALRAGTLLDVGCGRPCDSMPDGAFLRQAWRGVGVDVKPCRIPFEFRQAPVEELPFGNGAFDNVVAMEVMEHVDDLPRALGEVDRVLKSGGLFVMTVPDDNLIWHALWWIWTRLVGRMWRDTHKVSLDRKGWLGILKERFDIVNLGRHWYFDLIFVCRKKAT